MDKFILLFTFLFFLIFELFSLLFLFIIEFFVSILSSQFIENFSDFAEVFLLRVEAIILVFIFLGAEIGSDFFERREFIDILELDGFLSCFFVITGFKGKLTWIFLINWFGILILWVNFSKNFFSVSYN